jgi:hypothetical protein
MDTAQNPTPQPRYGDYPELFWDMEPSAPIAADHPMIIARILREGSLATIFKLVPWDVLERELPNLVIPDHTRLFWMRVLQAKREQDGVVTFQRDRLA